MTNIRLLIPLLFLPAGIGLVMQVLQAQTIAERLLLLALLLFCPELARMAWVDFETLSVVSSQQEDSRLSLFYKIVFSTVVLELLGFYGALWSSHGGAVVVIFSQLWFNLLAKIQLDLHKTPAIEPFGLVERLPVLIANAVGMGLLGGWFMTTMRVWLALGLLLLIVIFLLIKYLVPNVISLNAAD